MMASFQHTAEKEGEREEGEREGERGGGEGGGKGEGEKEGKLKGEREIGVRNYHGVLKYLYEQRSLALITGFNSQHSSTSA